MDKKDHQENRNPRVQKEKTNRFHGIAPMPVGLGFNICHNEWVLLITWKYSLA